MCVAAGAKSSMTRKSDVKSVSPASVSPSGSNSLVMEVGEDEQEEFASPLARDREHVDSRKSSADTHLTVTLKDRELSNAPRAGFGYGGL